MNKELKTAITHAETQAAIMDTRNLPHVSASIRSDIKKIRQLNQKDPLVNAFIRLYS